MRDEGCRALVFKVKKSDYLKFSALATLFLLQLFFFCYLLLSLIQRVPAQGWI